MILTDLRNITSLNNLYSKSRGQVATFLILMMVAVLILILVTVNLGTVSIQATNLSNAADSSALSLGSQIATKSNTLFKSLGSTTERCRKGGLAALVFGIILAVVAIVVAPYLAPTLVGATTVAGMTTGTMVAVGAAGGAVGGAIGGAYAGTGTMQGAIQGATVGAAIGAGIGQGLDLAYTNIGNMATFGNSAAIGGATLAAGSTLYNAAVAERINAAAFSAAAKALNGLPEYDRYREGAFLQAFSQVVDDPNTTADTSDSDGDGNTNEKIPYFQSWWEQRINFLKGIMPSLTSLTANFINGPLTNLRNLTQQQYASSCSTDEKGNESCASGLFARQEVEGSDGALAEVARALEDAGYDTSFFRPGSPPPANPDCDLCGPDNYYDEIYALSDNLNNLVSTIDGLKAQDMSQLTSTYHSWLVLFYDPETEWSPDNDKVNADWYDIFNNSIEPKLNSWENELETKRQALPQCGYGSDESGNSYVTNPPCQDGEFGTTDSALDDEFQEAKGEINNYLNGTRSFRDSVSDYYTQMNNTYAQIQGGYGGLNPVIYSWQDSRGAHSVTAEAGPFRMPRIEVRKYGNFLKNKTCLILMDYSDNGSRCWIKINRKEPADKGVKSGALALGRWNPYDNDDPLDPADSASDGKFSISRISRISYSYGYVGISGK